MKQTSFIRFSQAPPAVDTHIQASIRPGLINWRPSPFVIRVLIPFSFVLERIWHCRAVLGDEEHVEQSWH